MDYRRTKAGVTGYVGSIGLDPLFREELRRPWVGYRGHTVEGSSPPSVLYREDGYVLHIKKRLRRRVAMSMVLGPNCGGCVRHGSHEFFV